GTLEFLGRIDTQVKIRGMRVELGEIEVALQGCEGLAGAAVAARGAGAETRLIAYVVPVGVTAGPTAEVLPLEGVVDLDAVRARLKRVLPEHMVPAGFVGLTRLPLSASGKVDRKALPDVEADVARSAYEAPRNQTEAVICRLMREVVAHDRHDLGPVGI